MKYMLLVTQGEWMGKATEQERATAMAQIEQWWGRMFAEGKLVGGHQLQAPDTATTVVIERGRSSILDRPLMEAKEAIGGYGILEAANLDEALAIVRTYPQPDGKVEVRPIVER
jgi:hypothetical protein